MTTLSASAVSSLCNLATVFAVVFLFSQCGDAVLYLVAGFLYADSHLDVVHSIDLLFDANIVKFYCPQTIKAINVSFLLFIDNKS